MVRAVVIGQLASGPGGALAMLTTLFAMIAGIVSVKVRTVMIA